LLAIAAGVAACAGNDYRNQSPTISTIADQSIDQDTQTTALVFNVTDKETDASQLQVSITSSDNTLVTTTGVVVSGTGSSRSLQVTPVVDKSGSTQITLTVRDANGALSSSRFLLTVRDTRLAFTQFSKSSYATAGVAEPTDISTRKFIYDNDDNEGAYDDVLAAP
jgi:hypothetical protein